MPKRILITIPDAPGDDAHIEVQTSIWSDAMRDASKFVTHGSTEYTETFPTGNVQQIICAVTNALRIIFRCQ